jgi:hypothetical protein
MSDICPTVKIKRGDGFCVINESDFDPAQHEPWTEPPPAPALPPLPALPVPPVDLLAKLPADWRSQDAGPLRQLAAVVSGRAVENKRQAIDVIEAKLKSRG